MSSRRIRLLQWLTWFAFLNGLGLTLIAVSYLRYVPWPNDWLAGTFIALALPSQFVTIALLPWPLVALLIVLLPDRRLIIGVAATVYCALFLLLLVDTRVFALHRFHLNAMVWNVLTGGAASQILVFSTRDWVLAGGILLAAIVGFAGFALLLWRLVENGKSCKGFSVGAVVLVVLFATQAIHVWADAAHYTPVLVQTQLLPWPQGLVTAKRFLKRSGFSVQSAVVPEIRVEGLLRYPRQAMRCAKSSPNLDLLFIVVEGLRYDMANEKVMPNLHALGKDGWVFKNHLSGGNATRFGIFSLFYGVHGSYWHAFLSGGVGPVLMSEIERRGYELGIFASAPLSSPEFDRTVFVEVADRVEAPPPANTVDRRDVDITRRLEERLQSRAAGKPFFGFLFYDSPHKYAYPASFPAPFKPDLETVSYVTLGPDSDPKVFSNRYKNSLHFVDRLIGDLVEFLREHDLFEKTVIFVTGDHGQEFNETGQNYWGHNGNFSRYQIQVPLIVRWPGMPSGEKTHRTSHMDVVPTLMRHYFGCENPIADYSHGRDLLDDSARDYVTASSWSKSAIIIGKTVIVLQNHGIEVCDLDDYSPQPNRIPDSLLLHAIMRSRSQFLATGGSDPGASTTVSDTTSLPAPVH
jgi:membrane-anchored protein YejM (alkaline phosphatase superfamily)